MKIFLGLVLVAGLATAQSVGAKYGSREVATCPSLKDPVKGPPSTEQARRYVICGAEGQQGSNLFLLQDVNVEVGKGVAYRDIPQIHRPGNADPDGMVYQIRGSLKRYMCAQPNKFMDNFGKNCTVYDEPKATGECHKDNFGEWQCSLRDLGSPDKYGTANQPPPKN